MKVFVTGGAGYIGSHTILCLLEQGHDVAVYDNLSNSSIEALRRVEELTGNKVDFHEGDLLVRDSLGRVLEHGRFDAVVHFAGLKAVAESVENPLQYYRNNVVGTLNLLDSMDCLDIRRIVFSSSATVYGTNGEVPLVEKSPMGASNPYGRTKHQIEEILADLHTADPRWSIAILRYFNPAGAHESGRIGEDPQGTPNNLLPFVAQVAVGRRKKVFVYGDDYPTPDGTGVRDYIHVMDLAAGHVASLDYLRHNRGTFRWNLGTGRGSSVLEVIAEFSKVSGRSIAHAIAPRRPGDVAESYADASAALADLGWSARRDLTQMCRDYWRWQSSNPFGYADGEWPDDQDAASRS
jgi:UDP-glucose 4-epimerase